MIVYRTSILAGALLALAAPALAQNAAAPPAASPAAEPPAPQPPAVTAGKLTAVLLGELEVGDDGDPDGKGSATIDIAGSKLCFDVEYRRLAPVTMAHIHAGAAGKTGDPVVTLKLDPDEYIKGCTTVTPAVAAALLAAPGDHYVNVHTTELPKGAIRGQLGG
ncbi:MAG: CHRD domain-containing protein [Novosphingobium sp.]|nr:CHRD domain-containing protein [Novosphingobium sp.]